MAELIDECERRASGQVVRAIRIRHASSIPQATLQQAFQMLTVGTNLGAARLEAEAFDLELRCRCGFNGALGHDDLVGDSMVVCPTCGDISTRARTAEIELMSIETGQPDHSAAARNWPA